MASHNPAAPTRAFGFSRRAAPRLEVLDQFYGRLVALDLPLRVRDISAGGFSIESPISFPPGAAHQFRFTTMHGDAHILPATAIHCRTAQVRDGVNWHVTGFEFIQDQAGEVAGVVGLLMDAATSILTFE